MQIIYLHVNCILVTNVSRNLIAGSKFNDLHNVYEKNLPFKLRGWRFFYISKDKKFFRKKNLNSKFYNSSTNQK